MLPPVARAAPPAVEAVGGQHGALHAAAPLGHRVAHDSSPRGGFERGLCGPFTLCCARCSADPTRRGHRVIPYGRRRTPVSRRRSIAAWHPAYRPKARLEHDRPRAQSRHGPARVLCIVGEAGIDKTTLLDATREARSLRRRAEKLLGLRLRQHLAGGPVVDHSAVAAHRHHTKIVDLHPLKHAYE